MINNSVIYAVIIGLLSCVSNPEKNTDINLSSDISHKLSLNDIEKAPYEKAEIFMDGFISNKDEPEMCGAFSKDGNVFYYNALHKDKWSIFVTKKVNGKWITPKPLNITGGYTDRDFTMSPDGKKIYFGSDRPKTEGETKSGSLDIFVSEKISWDKWKQPKYIGDIINTEYTENYPSVDSKGNLYFFSCRKEGLGGCEIYVSKLINNKYQKPNLLSSNVNSKKHDWDSFIAPDGSYIIFSSQNRDNTIGKQDLYISFKDKKGNWTKSVNMGPKVNSKDDEICPSVSIDGKYMFFTSRRRGLADIFWIDAKIIEDLKPNN